MPGQSQDPMAWKGAAITLILTGLFVFLLIREAYFDVRKKLKKNGHDSL